MKDKLTRGPASFKWQDIAEIAVGEKLTLSRFVEKSLRDVRKAVDRIVRKKTRGYGINTGVGAKCNDILEKEELAKLSRNIIMSHAVGVGDPLGVEEVRAIMAAAVNNFSHGHSGISPQLVHLLVKLLNAHITPQVPEQGSVGYLSHMAHIGLTCLGAGDAINARGERLQSRIALRQIKESPFEFQSKDGLSFVNGTPCATGLACIALKRLNILVDWADWIAAMSFENMRGQADVFVGEALALRRSDGVQECGRRIAKMLVGSTYVDQHQTLRTQDALSLRSIPQVHGAIRDGLVHAEKIVNQELASTTDNPAILLKSGNSQHIYSEAHAIGAGIAMCTDYLAIMASHLAMIAERRIDRMINPLVSGLSPFLAAKGGGESGFMIAQYTALSLANENRRLSAPASLDGGITSALQEDYLCYAAPSALKLLKIIKNCYHVFAIEMLVATAAYRFNQTHLQSGRRLRALKSKLLKKFSVYADQAPLANEIREARIFLVGNRSPVI